ncbi:MAG: class II aldolase/adducin family protein [Deltaproteobacteria bacterium]|nr:class II aldolase/adducin family protein [Deltaproteobacteria bacterium]
MANRNPAGTARSANKAILEKLALACRILGTEGHDDMDLGHVSVRCPEDPERMIVKGRGLCLSEIHAEDLVTLDFDYKKVAGKREPHGEMPIHIEIYRARKDVNSIVHTHPLYATAFSATEQVLRPVNNEGVLFAKPLPFFSAETDLIFAPAQGRAVAEAMGDSKAIIMKNHGITVVGKSIEEAAVTAYLLEKTIKTLHVARGFGEPTWTDDAEAAKKADHIFQGNRIQAIWDTLARQLELREKPLRLLEALLNRG